MSDAQFTFLADAWARGLKFQTIEFNENGDMEVRFFDNGHNFHHQVIGRSGKLTTLEV